MKKAPYLLLCESDFSQGMCIFVVDEIIRNCALKAKVPQGHELDIITDKRTDQENIFLISSPKHMLWVLGCLLEVPC